MHPSLYTWCDPMRSTLQNLFLEELTNRVRLHTHGRGSLESSCQLPVERWPLHFPHMSRFQAVARCFFFFFFQKCFHWVTTSRAKSYTDKWFLFLFSIIISGTKRYFFCFEKLSRWFCNLYCCGIARCILCFRKRFNHAYVFVIEIH